MVTHALVKYEYQPGSFPQYRHYIECTCGFQARLGTKVAVQSQFNAHLTYHGVDTITFESEPEQVVEGENPAPTGPVSETIPDWMKPKE